MTMTVSVEAKSVQIISSVASVESFTTQTAWTTHTSESISLADNPSPQGPISEEERPTTTHGITEDAPYFVSPPLSTVRTRLGRPAVLTCVVKHIGNRQVSWIRGRDLHVLSSGQITFSSDARLSVAHSQDSWTLTIKFSQPRDAGTYSCQINTQPPQAVWYNLTVIGLVLWYQDDHLVERQSSRIKVTTKVTNVTTSTLTVEAARLRDSGNYSCWPSAGRPDSVLVHVIQGDPPAAMQHGSSAPGACPFLLVPMILTSLMFLLT
ncbi:hypothetical protein E2C01_034626 [Portunus trituberculatus]|uniref:Ig-like domain-containing protein n=1 Tax=Portunus trituberculatus TaxID=210409 RepID=A0A5B7F629_PORTR|nr:hypothetical protein [Portunus trituberculatus]